MTRTLELLGYAPDDRVLIIHADDAGFCHASNVAVFEALLRGSLTCASTIVPAPWFAETAKLCREHPQADMGIHTALNCEYETYRWPGVTAARGLHAPDGGMWRDVASVAANATPDEARDELRAQIERALHAGIDVTHLDTHMGTVMHPKFLAPYVELAIEYRLPLFFIRPNAHRLEALGWRADAIAAQSARLDALGWPLLDAIIVQTLSEIAPADKEQRFRDMFASLRPGLTHFLVHPAKRGEELDAITPGDAPHRAREYELFRDRSMRDYCETLGIKLTGYREIRDRLRASLPAA